MQSQFFGILVFQNGYSLLHGGFSLEDLPCVASQILVLDVFAVYLDFASLIEPDALVSELAHVRLVLVLHRLQQLALREQIAVQRVLRRKQFSELILQRRIRASGQLLGLSE